MRKLTLHGLLVLTLLLALGLEWALTRVPEPLADNQLVIRLGGDAPSLAALVPSAAPSKNSESDRDGREERWTPLQKRPGSPQQTTSREGGPGAEESAAPSRSPGPASRRPTTGKPVRHTVASGETLSDIARSYLGSAQRWPEIQSLNKIQDPRRVRAGDILQIPATR